jgi:hypothetical protein
MSLCSLCLRGELLILVNRKAITKASKIGYSEALFAFDHQVEFPVFLKMYDAAENTLARLTGRLLRHKRACVELFACWQANRLKRDAFPSPGGEGWPAIAKGNGRPG